MDLQPPNGPGQQPIAMRAPLKVITTTLSGEPFQLSSTAFIAASFHGELQPPGLIKLKVQIAFRPLPVKKGVVVVTECYIGTTGARVLVEATNATLQNLTSDSKVETQHEVAATDGTTAIVSPSVKLSDAEVSLGSVERAGSTTRKVSFSSGEALLVGTVLGPNAIQWSLRPHSGEKVVAEYLEGNLELLAHATWEGESYPTFLSSVEPRDRRFFGPKGKSLSLLASVALKLRLSREGIETPSYEAIKHSLAVRPNRS